MARAHKKERACNSIEIEILDVTKNKFHIAFHQSARELGTGLQDYTLSYTCMKIAELRLEDGNAKESC